MSRINGATIMGMIALVVGISGAVPRLVVPEENWWTPRSLMLGLSDARDKVVVIINDKRLGAHLEDQTLLVQGGAGPMPVTKEEIGFRINNYDKVRATRYLHAILPACIASFGLTMMIIGLFIAPKIEWIKKDEPPGS